MKTKMRSKVGGIFGIIGGAGMVVAFGILGIMMLTIAAALGSGEYYYDGETSDLVRSVIGTVTYLAGGVFGIVGGVISIRSDNVKGAIFIFVAAAFALTTGIVAIAPLAFVMLAVLLAGGIVSLAHKQPIVPRGGYGAPPYYGGGYVPPYGGNAPYGNSPYGGGYGAPPYYGGYVPPQPPPAQPEPFGEFGGAAENGSPAVGGPTDGNSDNSSAGDGRPTVGSPADGGPADGDGSDSSSADGGPAVDGPTDGGE